MKFAASLIAIGASAVKLHQEESHPVQRIIDWNGDGVISKREAMDQAYVFNATGYIDDDALAEAIEFYEDDEFPKWFTFDDVYLYIEESGDTEAAQDFAEYIEFSENVILDIVANYIFDEIDADGDDEIDIDEAEDFAEEHHFSDHEKEDFLDGFAAADEDGS